MKKFLAITAVCFILAACNSTTTSVTISTVTSLAITSGTNDTATRTERATKWITVARAIKATNDAGSGYTSLTTLKVDLEAQIGKLDPATSVLANDLIVTLSPILDDEIKAHPDLATIQSSLDTVLNAFIQTCQLYGAT